MKSCTKCGETKPYESFYSRKDRPGQFSAHCAPCVVERTRKSQKIYKSHDEVKAKHAAYMRQYNRDHPGKIKGANLRRYWPDLDWRGALAEFNRLFAEQSGCCKICNKHQSQLRQAICVDHCSETRQVRGLLCHECNRAIGFLRHDISILQSAIDYLESSK